MLLGSFLENQAIRRRNPDMAATLPRPSATRQSLIGLSLAAAIFGTWLVLHIWAMFAFRMDAANWYLVPLIFALQCWLSVGMFIVAHDAMHGSLMPRAPKAGQAIGAVLLFLYAGFGWRRMRDAHFDHHRHVGTANDPDFHAGNPHDFWPWYAQFLRRYFGPMSMIWVWTVVLTYYLLLDVPPENIALLYGFPAIASSLQLFYFGTYRPHRHEAAELSEHQFRDHQPFPDHHRARTNDYGTLASLFSCFHFGYHHEHHLHPGTPWWGLPARHRDYVNDNS
jgi:beta-carotene/zeaxanthin 4-ketolase